MSNKQLQDNLTFIKEWIDKHIYDYTGDHFNMLMKKEILTFDDIENFYKSKTESDEENDDEPQEVYQWLQGSELAYKVYRANGNPVAKCNEIYFIGRTCYGQSMEVDFYYDNEKFIKLIKSAYQL